MKVCGGITTVALLLGSALASEAHDHSSMMNSTDMAASPVSMAGGHHHGRPILDDPNLEPQQLKYWQQYNTTSFFNSDQGNRFALYSHATLTVSAWALLYPICLLLAFEPSAQWVYLPLQTLTSACAVGAIFFLGVFSSSAPSLYPGNVYGLFSVVLLLMVAAHYFALVTKSVAKQLGYRSMDGAEYVLADMTRPSNDSGHELSDEGSDAGDFDLASDRPTMHMDRSSSLVQRFSHNSIVNKVASGFGSVSTVVFAVLTVLLGFMGFAEILIGAAVGFSMGKGHMVFGLLAHWIKGGVFFILGFLELARYFGCLSKYGMAWNLRPEEVAPTKHSRSAPGTGGRRAWYKIWPEHPTMEFFQSLLILTYGLPNLFLEHLGSKDGIWTPKDLQHVSIAFMFVGGGLCGLAIESATLRKWMARGFGFEATSARPFNPMPAFTIFWTGALMSRHQQETELATQIHVQWGALLSLAALLRGFTYLMLYLREKPDNSEPQRPFTEVLVSFCLVCGGMIFMLSNRETVEALIYRGFDSMFVLNVGVGVTTLFMSYAILVFAAKGLASR